MTNEALLELALQAIQDVDARVVLHDAIEEVEWNDRRAVVLTFGEEPGQGTGYQFRTAALTKLGSGTRAIAAVLLFGNWDQEMWPLAKTCRRRPLSGQALRVLHDFEEEWMRDLHRIRWDMPISFPRPSHYIKINAE